MKVGTLVRLRTDKYIHDPGQVVEFGLGVVIKDDGHGPDRIAIVLVSFPKLGVEQWRTARLLEVVK